MGERENPDGVRHFQIRDAVRKPRDGHFASRYVSRHTGHTWCGMRPAGNAIERGIDGFEEFGTEPGPLLFVPQGGLFEFSGSFGLVSEGTVHLSANRRATRARTSSHGSPADSPAITRLARRSISRAHAASIAAGSIVVGSSRLARSSAATSARSSVGKAKASRRSSCARDVMWPF